MAAKPAVAAMQLSEPLMYEYFTHLRMVHNAQTLISLMAVYLIWASPATELYGDLAAFRDVVTKAGQAVERSGNLDDLAVEMPDHKASLHRDLRTALGAVYIVDSHSLPVEMLTSFPDQSVPLRVLWQELQNQRWRVPDRLTVPRNVLGDMRAWLDEWRRCYPALTRHLDGTGRDGRDEARRYTIPTLRIAVSPERRRAEVVSVILQLAVYSPAVQRHYCRGDSRADFYERDFDLQVTREYKRFGPLYLWVQRTGVSLPASLFDRYQHLKRALGDLGNRTLEEALAWADEQQRAEVRERELRLVGARLTGEDLGFIVPFAVIALHVYMLVMLRSLNFGNGTHLGDPIPWLVAVPSPLAFVSSLLTLMLLPAGASGLALWRLTTMSGVDAFVFALMPLGIAVWIYAEARRASGNLRRVSSGVSQK